MDQSRPSTSGGGAANASPPVFISFEGIDRLIAMTPGVLLERLEAVLYGWPFKERPGSSTDSPVISLLQEKEGFRLESTWLKSPTHHRHEVDAICAFIVELIRAYIFDNPALLCLHCAAAVFAGRLVIFPSHYRAGKSTLVAGLAAAGVCIYADDVLPIRNEGNTAISPGIAPRLRLPLPEEAGKSFHRFVEARRGPESPRYLYLNPQPGEVARHGEEAPIGACVLLDRQKDGRTELHPTPKSKILRRVILRNFARKIPASEVLDRLHAIVDEGQCFRLRYSNLEDAISVLQEAFSEWPSEQRKKVGTEESFPPAASSIQIDKTAEGPQFTRIPDVVEKTVDHDIFLVNSANESIFHLNPTGAALWRLFAEPIRIENAVDILHEAFPDVDKTQIERDVIKLVASLRKRGLIRAISP